MTKTVRPITPEDFEWFERDQMRRLMRQQERAIYGAIGDPLRGLDAAGGTFSNRPEQPSVDNLLETMRRIEYSPQLDRPKRIEFGSVAVAGFWASIQNIEFRELPKSLDEYSLPLEQGELVITSLLPDRDTGKPIGITFTFRVPLAAWNHEPSRPELLRAAIKQWLHHEIDEHIFVDGKRAFDPHKREPIPQPIAPLPFTEAPPIDDGLRYFSGYRRVRP